MVISTTRELNDQGEVVINKGKKDRDSKSLLAIGASGNVMVAHLVRAIQELEHRLTLVEA